MCLARIEVPRHHHHEPDWPDGRRQRIWRRLKFGGKERWGRLKAWGRTNLDWTRTNILGVEQTITMVTEWVLGLNVNFGLITLPLLFLLFLTILSPHTDIQLCVIGCTLSLLLVSVLLNSCGIINLSSDSSIRITATRLFYTTETEIRQENDEFAVRQSFRMRVYKKLPLKELSRGWGWLADVEYPGPFKYLAVWLFATLAKCDRSEAEFESVFEYKTISQFFRRRLKPGVRPVCLKSSIVSPADGTLTFIGPVVGPYLQQVKGIRYCLRQFLGPVDEATVPLDELGVADDILDDRLQEELEDVDEIDRSCTMDDSSKTYSVMEVRKSFHSDVLEFESCVRVTEMEQISEFSDDLSPYLINPGGSTALYQAVVYLSPSDYHRFHSPADWTVYRRRHFPGALYSVAPRIVRAMPGLFHSNERVVLFGRWQYGFFSMTAVGATNVGSIVMNFDDTLCTNTRHQKNNNTTKYSSSDRPDPDNTGADMSINEDTCNDEVVIQNKDKLGRQDNAKEGMKKMYQEREWKEGVRVTKGEEMGYFNFGSTIVLVFEAPRDFTPNNLGSGSSSRVKVGQGL